MYKYRKGGGKQQTNKKNKLKPFQLKRFISFFIYSGQLQCKKSFLCKSKLNAAVY